MLKTLATLGVALFLAACGPAQKIADFATRVTAAIVKPVDQVNIYRVKNVYDAAGKASARWRAKCWERPYAALMADPVYAPICKNRRPVLRAIVAADDEASGLIAAAERSGGDAVMAAWDAVLRFQGKVPVTP